MKVEDFNLAIGLITTCHSSTIHINKVKENGSVTKVLESPTIHIENCVSSVIILLMEQGFSLSMDNGLMSVSKY